MAFFKQYGYIIKRGLVPAAALAPFVDRFWSELVPPCIDRRDAASWVDPATNPGWDSHGP